MEENNITRQKNYHHKLQAHINEEFYSECGYTLTYMASSSGLLVPSHCATLHNVSGMNSIIMFRNFSSFCAVSHTVSVIKPTLHKLFPIMYNYE